MSNRKPSFIDRVREHIFKVWPGQVLVPPPDPTQPSGLDLVARELHRVRAERARDHQYGGEELARAAACYISADHLVVEHTGQSPWPWVGKDDRGELTRVEQLVRGAALAIREIERLLAGEADHLAGAGKMVETEPNGHLSDADLVERAVRNAGYLITDGEVRRWAAVRDTFAVGSSSAFHLCRRFGLDPDAMVGCLVIPESPLDRWDCLNCGCGVGIEEDGTCAGCGASGIPIEDGKPCNRGAQGTGCDICGAETEIPVEVREYQLCPGCAESEEVESLAAAKVADKQPEESRVRIYCWKVGTAFWRKPNGDCPECGKYGHNHRVLPANECGTFVDCQGKHGHPCVLPPDHKGPHAAPEALAECLHAAGNEMVKGGGG